jgi:hypothetical protein
MLTILPAHYCAVEKEPNVDSGRNAHYPDVEEVRWSRADTSVIPRPAYLLGCGRVQHPTRSAPSLHCTGPIYKCRLPPTLCTQLRPHSIALCTCSNSENPLLTTTSTPCTRLASHGSTSRILHTRLIPISRSFRLCIRFTSIHAK